MLSRPRKSVVREARNFALVPPPSRPTGAGAVDEPKLPATPTWKNLPIVPEPLHAEVGVAEHLEEGRRVPVSEFANALVPA